MFKIFKGDSRKNRRRRRRTSGYVHQLGFEPLEDRRVLATLTVGAAGINSENPTSGPAIVDNAVLTLREAIAYVNRTNTAGPSDSLRINDFQGTQPLGTNDRIVFDSSLNGAMINLLASAGGELSITHSVTIDASMLSHGITIDASTADSTPSVDNGDGSRIFNITGGSVELDNLTLTGADAIALDRFGNPAGGGAIYSDGANLKLQGSTITGNAASYRAGGLYFSGTNVNLKIYSSTFSNNHSGTPTGSYGRGGGLYTKVDNGVVKIQDSHFNGNISNGNYSTGNTGADGAGACVNATNCPQVTITNTSFTGNFAHGAGTNSGGIEVKTDNCPDVRLETLVITGNHADDDAGGLYIINSASTVKLVNSTISGNFGSDNDETKTAGGGLAVAGKTTDSVTIIDSTTIDHNHTINNTDSTPNSSGGGCSVEAGAGSTTTFVNCTISTNDSVGRAGGIYISDHSLTGGDVYIRNCTITGNRSDLDNDSNGPGGGIYKGSSSTTVTLNNTIVAANSRGSGSTGQDITGAVTGTYNLIGDGRGATVSNDGTNKIGYVTTTGAAIVPGLGPLRNNGGPTMTHALLPGSQALNSGDPAAVAGSGTTALYDQRGTPWSRVELSGRIDIGAVESQTNPLQGDYNFNGIVDAADYTVWRDTLGSTTDLRADGDGNGVINPNDYVIWKMAFGSHTGLVLADASGNGAVDIADYNVWASTYHSTTDLRADCNQDGIVDDADYEIWFDTFGSTLQIAQFGLLSSMFAPNAPPEVVGFALSLPGDSTVDFAGRVGSGDQLRSVPLIAANTLSITFSQNINVTQNELQVINLDGTSPTVSGFAYDAASQTATWTFSAALADGRYVVRLSDAVENMDGQALDGEFFNPSSLTETNTAYFPSGDGDAGGEFRFRFTVLFADSNNDNVEGTSNFQNWKSTEPGMIIVSTTTDDFDSDLSFGDVSLREAVNFANAAGEPTTIDLPAGRYTLTRTGTEGTGTAYNDLDVLAAATIQGDGAGLSVIVPGWSSGYYSSASWNDDRLFEVKGSAAHLILRGVTLADESTDSYTTYQGGAVLAENQAQLDIIDSAIVNNTGFDTEFAVRALGSNVTILRSVFTNNSGYDGSAVDAETWGGHNASLTIGQSIFALNGRSISGGGTPNVTVGSGTTITDLGNNLFDNAAGGFFNVLSATGDHLGTPQYVVTSVADTFDHTNDVESLSLREAVDKANTTSGTQEIWVPAWHFTLTRDRGTHTSDTDVSYGDLDVKDSLVVRGITGKTSVAWKAGVVDKVFDLIGDFNNDGQTDFGTVSSADYTIWQDQNGSSGAYEQFSADANDDGHVDSADYTLWSQNYGHTLQLLDVSA